MRGRIDIIFPDEAQPGDVILRQNGERRNVRRVLSQGTMDEQAVVESYVNGHEQPQIHYYNLNVTVKVEKGR